MKKLIVLTAIFCLYFQAITVAAATPDYSGEWNLDVSRSKLPEQAKVESMTLKVSQTEKEMTIETTAKRSPDAGRGGMNGGMRRGGGGAQTAVYNLDGSETTAETGGGTMAGSEKRTAKVMTDGKLSLTSTRSFKTEMGDVVTKTNETWELVDGGKTLKIVRYTETPRGGINSEMYFTKTSGGKTVEPTTEYQGAAVVGANQAPKIISGGVLNGKAVSLPLPAYPAAARAVKASGAVNVQVTIDESGNVISASAVSGHPLLRQAAEEAARQAKFAPVTLSGTPVSVTGVIVYNFVP